MLQITLSDNTFFLNFGMYNTGGTVYSVNSLGVFATNNFGTKMIYGDKVFSDNELILNELELKALERTIRQ